MLAICTIYFVTLVQFAALILSTNAQAISQNQIQDKIKVVNISYNRCSTNKMCVHGVCNERMGTCACYYGWRGEVCNRLVRNNRLFSPRKVIQSEPYKVSHNVITRRRRLMTPDSYVLNLLMAFFPKLRSYFKRILDIGVANKQTTNTFYTSPVATSNFAMRLKEKTLASTRKPLQRTRKPSTDKPEIITTESPEIEMTTIISETKQSSEEVLEEPETIDNGVCSDSYKTRPLSERMCTPGLVCNYGVCSSEHKGTYIAFDCSCDKGASGLLCENKCCLYCGSNGRCRLFPDGKQFCQCRRGYFGDNCEQSETHLSNPHFTPSNKLYNVFTVT